MCSLRSSDPIILFISFPQFPLPLTKTKQNRGGCSGCTPSGAILCPFHSLIWYSYKMNELKGTLSTLLHPGSCFRHKFLGFPSHASGTSIQLCGFGCPTRRVICFIRERDFSKGDKFSAGADTPLRNDFVPSQVLHRPLHPPKPLGLGMVIQRAQLTYSFRKREKAKNQKKTSLLKCLWTFTLWMSLYIPALKNLDPPMQPCQLYVRCEGFSARV
jgi:hypothetical protein